MGARKKGNVAKGTSRPKASKASRPEASRPKAPKAPEASRPKAPEAVRPKVSKALAATAAVLRSIGHPSFDWKGALAHLSDGDAKLAKIIEKVGAERLEVSGPKSPFESLVRSIVFQQLHGKAAATIHGRLAGLFTGGRILPEVLLTHGDDALRAVGLSRGKIAALRDLAARTLDGTVPAAAELDAMDDDDIVERLVRVRGIGRWTAEMLLIFSLGRPDVLPVHDYGVRHGFKLTYGKRTMPTPDDIARWGERWRPFRTIASWYMWRAVDLAKRAEASAEGKASRRAPRPSKRSR